MGNILNIKKYDKMGSNKFGIEGLGYGDENHLEFIPLIDSFRKVSADKTPLDDNFVSFARNVYDMIDGEEKKPDIPIKGKYITDVLYDSNKNTLLIYYNDKTSKTLEIKDNFISSISYGKFTNKIYFRFTNGSIIEFNVSDLENVFYNKGTIDMKLSEIYNIVNNKDNLKWGNF